MPVQIFIRDSWTRSQPEMAQKVLVELKWPAKPFRADLGVFVRCWIQRG